MDVQSTDGSPDPKSFLLVGDGNLSFSLAFARRLLKLQKEKSAKTYTDPQSEMKPGDYITVESIGVTIVATTLESKAELIAKYPESEKIIEELHQLKCIVLHEIDATKLSQSLLKSKGICKTPIKFDVISKYDRIIFQFPLIPPSSTPAEFARAPNPILNNKLLLRRFLRCSSTMLSSPNGLIQITSKNVKPYAWWRIQTLAVDLNIGFFRTQEFIDGHFPNYETRKPTNCHYDRTESFPFTQCATYIFGFMTDAIRQSQPTRSDFFCDVCEKDMMNIGNMRSHCTSKKHKHMAHWQTEWERMLSEQDAIDQSECDAFLASRKNQPNNNINNNNNIIIIINNNNNNNQDHMNNTNNILRNTDGESKSSFDNHQSKTTADSLANAVGEKQDNLAETTKISRIGASDRQEFEADFKKQRT